MTVHPGLPVRRSGDYWRESRSRRYSLALALPLLIAYQLLAALVPQAPGHELRNGADAILQMFAYMIGGPRGPIVFSTALVVGTIGLIVVDTRRRGGGRLAPSVLVRMWGEACLYALLFGLIVGAVTAELMGGLSLLHFANPEPLARLPMATQLMLSLGAGIYEELLFRVILVSGLAMLGRVVLGWRPTTAGIAATIVGAAVFSAFHYVGPFGDRFTAESFVFRMVGGIFFSGLYLLRGFGIVSWTHALYDVVLLSAG